MPIKGAREERLTEKRDYPGETEEEYEPSPEDFAPEPERPRGPLSRFPAPAHALPAMMMFIAFFMATAAYTGFPQGDYLWVSGEALFTRHEFWRIITALFTHADFHHLLANSITFMVFGWMLRAYFGSIAFPAASIVIGAFANLITVILYEPKVRLLGSSGMAYGMVALWLVFYIRHDTYRTVPMRIFRSIGFALVMLFPSTFDPRVSYLAHAVGFAAGLVSGFILIPWIRVRETG